MNEAIRKVSRNLTSVHRILLQQTIRAYEEEQGARLSPQDAWRAAMSDPFFAWLRPVSMLIAEIDEVLANPEEVGPDYGLKVRRDVEGLLGGGRFGERYQQQLQDSPELVTEHGQLRAALAALPEPSK